MIVLENRSAAPPVEVPHRQPPVVRNGDTWNGDARALARALARVVEGEVGFDAGSRALHATDASNYRQVPIGVVSPRSIDDVVATVALCREHGAPLLSRGGGTSLAGQCCNVAVVLDWTRHLGRVLELDPQRRLATVEPGTVLDVLRARAAPYDLTFGPDPATHTHCTLGGMIGNNSCGVHSVMAGRTADNVRALEVLTYDGLRLRVGRTSGEELRAAIAAGGRRGEIYAALDALRSRYATAIRARFPDIPRRVSGYGLEQLLPENGFDVARALVGSEGTCVTTLEATVELVPSPPCRALLAVGFDDIYRAADVVPLLLETAPVGLEAIDARLLSDQRRKGMNAESLRLLDSLEAGWLLVELGGDTQEEANERARRSRSAIERSVPNVRQLEIFTSREEQDRIWEIRESGLGATARVPGRRDTWPGWEDSAVAPERLGSYLRELRRLLDRFDYTGAFYGHFGQGCLHTRIDFDLRSERGRERYRAFVGEAADLVVRHGGSLSGEHGDGQARAELLERMYGPELTRAFREFKAIWDPQNRMNPGKVCDPYPILSNLRLEGYPSREPEVAFRYPEDDFRFSRAALRCVGVGKCRRLEGGVMCPSYRVTRDEKHSTRGRAHLLWEMLQGEVVGDGWRSEEVKESLDLCLSCKGCKHECPVSVDVATYKAEFLHHYYRGRLRPTSAYAMGLVHWGARAARLAPRLVNSITHAPLLGAMVKATAGISAHRELPWFAPSTFRDRFRDHRPRHPGGARVLLYPDTFTDHFSPAIGEAAVAVLEDAGFRVEIPERPLCCGRPLYDQGFLPLAAKLLRRNLEALAPAVARGTPIVVLEPSCAAVFRDELRELLPRTEAVERLSASVVTLPELLRDRAPDWEPPQLARRAVVHGHCHHRSVLGFDSEVDLLRRTVRELEVLDSGCCGMAGSFGFEPEKYAVSMACGEEVLLPAVRAAPRRDLILADGFSCRTQIEQATERRAVHVAQVLAMALREGGSGPPGESPERDYVDPHEKSDRALAALGAGAALAIGAAVLFGRRRRRRRRGADGEEENGR